MSPLLWALHHDPAVSLHCTSEVYGFTTSHLLTPYNLHCPGCTVSY